MSRTNVSCQKVLAISNSRDSIKIELEDVDFHFLCRNFDIIDNIDLHLLFERRGDEIEEFVKHLKNSKNEKTDC